MLFLGAKDDEESEWWSKGEGKKNAARRRKGTAPRFQVATPRRTAEMKRGGINDRSDVWTMRPDTSQVWMERVVWPNAQCSWETTDINDEDEAAV